MKQLNLYEIGVGGKYIVVMVKRLNESKADLHMMLQILKLNILRCTLDYGKSNFLV